MKEQHAEDSLKDDLNFIGEEKSRYSDSSTHKLKSIDTKLAELEDKDWGRLRQEIDGQNGLILEQVFFKIAVYLVRLLFILFGILILVWFYHLISPECIRWLKDSEVQSIERILFASTLLSLAGKYFSKYKILRKD